ncbi:unnamed protein product [Candidula unifasciata]|uniref:Glutathione S-transferase n=1 Tax=Candidula unifasciata TaxID=100452 RepID=A0A8S3YQ63_9EUPU|nr:unnamed protein product [Candidula unifasciata]
MANSNLKLYHFDEKGRAEVLRLILTLAGKSFEDIRMTRQEWLEVKPTMPFGQVPVLEVDGHKFCQGVAIANYLADEFGFYGETTLDRLRIDMISQLVYDFRFNAAQYYFSNNGITNPAIGDTIREEHVPKYLSFLEQLLKENVGKFMVGDSITLADLVVFDMVTGFLGEFVEPKSAEYPILKDLVDRVGNHEKIKQYLAEKYP